MLSPSVTPLLVLVNVKSGGQQGMALIRSFRKLLNPHQVYDLMNGGPLPGSVIHPVDNSNNSQAMGLISNAPHHGEIIMSLLLNCWFVGILDEHFDHL